MLLFRGGTGLACWKPPKDGAMSGFHLEQHQVTIGEVHRNLPAGTS
jgi:hypothetical protein